MLEFYYYLQGEQIRDYLATSGIPRRVLAEDLDITPGYLSQLISGRRHLSINLRYRLQTSRVLAGLSQSEMWRSETRSATSRGSESDTVQHDGGGDE